MLYRFSEFELDDDTRELRNGGRVIPIEPTPLRLLATLVRASGRVVTNEQLLDLLWPDAAVTQSSIGQAVRKARAALDQEGDGAQLIRTVRGRGYRLGVTAEREPESGAMGSEMDRPALAVVPFENMSRDVEQEYFADGLAEDLITRLAVHRWFPVIARDSSFAYKGRSVDVTQVAGELGASYVVRGSVRRSGDRVRVSVQLVDGRTGQNLWAQRYDRLFEDAIDVQDEIAASIASSLGVSVSEAESGRAFAKELQNLDAWDHVLRGLYHLARVTREDNEKARTHFEKAIGLDPRFLWPRIELAATLNSDLTYAWTRSRTETIAALWKAASACVELDAQYPGSQVAMAFAHAAAGRAEESAACFERAVELDPNDARVQYWLGMAHIGAGREEQAIPNIEAAIRLGEKDASASRYFFAMALACFGAERYEDAHRWAQKGQQLRPREPLFAGLVLACRGMLGMGERARDLLRSGPGFNESQFRAATRNLNPRLVNRLLKGLRAAGWAG